MACAFESKDNSMIVSPADNNSEYWNSTELLQEVNRIQNMYPQLTRQDLASSQRLLDEQKLLPGFDLIASRDADGRVKDASGRVVILNKSEMTQVAVKSEEANVEAFQNLKANAGAAFDRFSVGNPNAAPDDLIHLARISEDQLSDALQRLDITAEEKQGLKFLKFNFDQLHKLDPFYSNESISKTAINRITQPRFAPYGQELNDYSTIANNVFFDSYEGYAHSFFDSSRSTDINVFAKPGSKRPAERTAIAEDPSLEIYSVFEFEDPSKCQTNLP